MTEEEGIIFRKKFARWLDEWELEQEFHIQDIDVGSSEANHQIPFKKPTYNDIKAGDILLLSNELTFKGTSLIKPLFVAILRLWEKEDNDEFFLWAPYSPFTQPATDKEIKFENSDPRLSILSLWNTHTSPKELLSNSWFIGELEEKDRKNALKVFWYSLGMEELTNELEEKIGPKLFHSEDPRRKYIEEELSKTSVIRKLGYEPSITLTATSTDGEKIIQFPPVITSEETGEKIAAANKDDDLFYIKLLCKELPIKLEIQYNPERSIKVYFDIHTENEELKKSIDLFSVKMIEEESTIPPFTNGITSYEMSMESFKFSLIDPSGTPLTLMEP